jgi:hypothetical protein
MRDSPGVRVSVNAYCGADIGSAFEKRFGGIFGGVTRAQFVARAKNFRLQRQDAFVEFMRGHGGKILARNGPAFGFARRILVGVDGHGGFLIAVQRWAAPACSRVFAAEVLCNARKPFSS